MSTRDIRKVTLLKVKDGQGLIVKFNETDVAGAAAKDDKESMGLIHPDLKAAMRAFGIHWALLAGLVKIGEVPDIAMPEHDILDRIHINGVSIGGNEGTQGIILSGHYITWRSKAQQLNTPFELFDCAPESRYVYMDDVQAKLTVLLQEVELYLSGKRGEAPIKPKKDVDPNQGNLEFANKEAMDRVAQMGTEGEGGKSKKNTGTRRRVQQTAEAPSGAVEEGK